MLTRPPLPTRIISIDALRGFALFGVLLINVQIGFRGPLLLRGGSTAPGSADAFVLRAIELLIQGKSIAIFSMLFGVGLAIQHESLSRRAASASYLVRRLGLLFLFGLAHLLIWSGDVLIVYALAGLLSLPVLLAPRTTWFLPVAAIMFVTGALLPLAPLDLLLPSREWFGTHLRTIGGVLANGSFAEISVARWGEMPVFAISDAFLTVHTIALVLIGAWAWRSGLLLPDRDKACALRRIAVICVPLGAVLTLIVDGWPLPLGLPRWFDRLLDDLAPLVLAIGYANVFLLFVARRGAWVTAFLAPVGRMAFTNYLSQTVILAVLFYGYGFGLSGRLGVIACTAVALAIFAMQMAWSRWWLDRHRFGPLEWLWRSGMYGRWQQWRRIPGNL